MGASVIVLLEPVIDDDLSLLGRREPLRIQDFATERAVEPFIVPRNFRKDSIQRQLDRRFHFVNELVLPEEAFVFEEASYSVPSCFQVWERRTELRPASRKPTTHAAFAFCTPKEADFALQRVGANAGRIKSVSEARSKNSHYFLRANYAPCTLRAQFELIDFDTVRQNTAGCPSISKSEVVHLFSEALGQTTI